MRNLSIVIETKRGQYRYKSNQPPIRYSADYGYIENTEGADGDEMDVFVGMFPDAPSAYIINQYHDAEKSRFDEHKVMLSFYDQKQAVQAYKDSYPYRAESSYEVFACNENQFNWWLKYGNHKRPVTLQSFPFDPESENVMTYDWTDENLDAARAIYDMRRTDEGEDLLEAATLDDVIDEMELDGAELLLEGAELAAFDALVIQNKQLPRKANIIGKAINRAGSTLQVAENGIQISDPYRQSGVTQVAIVYELTDGQTITILMHNKDATPAKIAADDNLIAWKWMLNRKDITIVVAKENGRDQNINVVARRVMLLAEKNTARFAKANAQRMERLARLETDKQEIAALEQTLATKVARIDGLKVQIQTAKTQPKPVEPVTEIKDENLNNPAQNAINEGVQVNEQEAEVSGGLNTEPARVEADSENIENSTSAEPESMPDTQPETVENNAEPVLLHTSKVYSEFPGYRPYIEGRDEEIKQFEQAGFTLDPDSIDGKNATYSVFKDEAPYHVAISVNWYSDNAKSYWVNVSAKDGYVVENGSQMQALKDQSDSVEGAINLADELLNEAKRNNQLREVKEQQIGVYRAQKGRSRAPVFQVIWNPETDDYKAIILWSTQNEEKILSAKTVDELKVKINEYFSSIVKGKLPVIEFDRGIDILGLGNSVETEQPEVVEPAELDLTQVDTSDKKQLGKAVENWLKNNLQGKTITTVDGKKVRFNRNDSVWHLSHDGRNGELEALAVGKIVEVFQTGEAKGREVLTKPRNDFVAFHRYDKWLELKGQRVHVVAKAGERADGTLELMPDLVAYSSSVYKTKAAFDASLVLPYSKEYQARDLPKTALDTDAKAIFDDSQEAEEPLATLVILEIRDADGTEMKIDGNGELVRVDEAGLDDKEQLETNPQEAADKAYLQDVIAGKVDFMADDFDDKLLAVVERYDGKGGEMEELCMAAVNAYTAKLDELSA